MSAGQSSAQQDEVSRSDNEEEEDDDEQVQRARAWDDWKDGKSLSLLQSSTKGFLRSTYGVPSPPLPCLQDVVTMENKPGHRPHE